MSKWWKGQSCGGYYITYRLALDPDWSRERMLSCGRRVQRIQPDCVCVIFIWEQVREGYKRAHHISEAAIVIYCAHKSRALCPTRGKTLLLVRQQTESPSHNTFRGSSLSLSLFPSIPSILQVRSERTNRAPLHINISLCFFYYYYYYYYDDYYLLLFCPSLSLAPFFPQFYTGLPVISPFEWGIARVKTLTSLFIWPRSYFDMNFGGTVCTQRVHTGGPSTFRNGQIKAGERGERGEKKTGMVTYRAPGSLSPMGSADFAGIWKVEIFFIDFEGFDRKLSPAVNLPSFSTTSLTNLSHLSL